MAEYRKHWLINSLGQRYDFTEDNSKLLFSRPQGFGFRREYETIKVGNSELVMSQQFDLTDITGQLLFYRNQDAGDIYQDYRDFIGFVKFKPLMFFQLTPNDINPFYCDVLLTNIDKPDIGENGILSVNVTFHRLTEWLDAEDYTIVLTNEPTGEGKYYPLVRPYHYAGTDLSNTPINNNGTDDVGFILEINGECQNPQFTITQNGEQYAVCKINGTYDYVLINSVERTESIYLERNGSTISNPEQYQDFTIRNGLSYLTWCKFRVGKSIISITMGNIDSFDGTIVIKFKNSYVSV